MIRPQQPKAMSNIIECSDCGGKVSVNANACPHCGNAKIQPYQPDLYALFNSGPKCPACGGSASKLAGNRGRAFGEGNFFSALTKSMRCNGCGHCF
jgi:predicted RNA-binding Zn-ribbon protein involved in translation (DUF1610 family)